MQAALSTQRFPNHSKGEQDDDRRTDDDESDDITAVLKMMGTRHIHCITRDDSEERVKIKDLSAQSKLSIARGRKSDAQPDVGPRMRQAMVFHY